MTLEEIKDALKDGERVCWKSDVYEVREWKQGLVIYCTINGYATGFTHRDGVTLNEDEEDFYISHKDSGTTFWKP